LIIWFTISFSFAVIINTCLHVLNPSINLSIINPIKITLKNPNNPLSIPKTLIAAIQTNESVSKTEIPIPIGVNLLIIAAIMLVPPVEAPWWKTIAAPIPKIIDPNTLAKNIFSVSIVGLKTFSISHINTDNIIVA